MLACIISIILLNNSAFAQNSNYKVAAGGGNGTNILMKYMPNFLSINIGDSVTWYNPTDVEEPHTITFVMDKGYFPLPAFPFNISNTALLNPFIPNLNAEPLILPNNYIQNKITKVKQQQK